MTPPVRATGPRPEPEQWIDEGVVREEASRAIARGERKRSAPAAPPAQAIAADHDLVAELGRAVSPRDAGRLAERLLTARRAFERERYPEARRILERLATSAPTSASVRELYGLTLYRLGRFKEAARELEAFRSLSGSTEAHAVLADCYRAQRRWSDVEELWDELCAASPAADIVTEGRIVMAGSLADRGDLRGAIRLLEEKARPPRVVRDHHLRLWYALADLYERAGDVPRARSLFRRIADEDRDFVDVVDRLSHLG